ncbi:hypothetical protein PO124_15560 [Bacillus licheniformis]|nr:hypothetical protein [Bacillus licheniformis]
MRVRLYRMLEPQALNGVNVSERGYARHLADDVEHLQDMYLRTVFPGLSALLYMAYSSQLSAFSWPLLD